MGILFSTAKRYGRPRPKPATAAVSAEAAKRTPEEELKSCVDNIVRRLQPVMDAFVGAHCELGPGLYTDPDLLSSAWMDYLYDRDLLDDWKFYLTNQTATGLHLRFAPNIRAKIITANSVLTSAAAAISEGATGISAAPPMRIIYLNIALKTFPMSLEAFADHGL